MNTRSQVIKRDGSVADYQVEKVRKALESAFNSTNAHPADSVIELIMNEVNKLFEEGNKVHVEQIQDTIEYQLMGLGWFDTAKSFILYRDKHKNIRDFAQKKNDFINKYKNATNTADASIDDNSNVANKNIAVLNTELYKENNIELNRYRVTKKLQELYPEFDASQYVKDIESHIIYKNDENSTFGFPYCVAISMYPFLLNGIKDLGGLSAAPKNIDSFCGMFVNLVFAVSSQYAGAVATSEFLVCFDYFARKEWGENYHRDFDKCISQHSSRVMTIQKQIHQYFQQIT